MVTENDLKIYKWDGLAVVTFSREHQRETGNVPGGSWLTLSPAISEPWNLTPLACQSSLIVLSAMQGHSVPLLRLLPSGKSTPTFAFPSQKTSGSLKPSRSPTTKSTPTDVCFDFSFSDHLLQLVRRLPPNSVLNYRLSSFLVISSALDGGAFPKESNHSKVAFTFLDNVQLCAKHSRRMCWLTDSKNQLNLFNPVQFNFHSYVSNFRSWVIEWGKAFILNGKVENMYILKMKRVILTEWPLWCNWLMDWSYTFKTLHL